MTCIWLIEEGTKNENHVPCTWNNLLDVQIKKGRPLKISKRMEVKKKEKKDFWWLREKK